MTRMSTSISLVLIGSSLVVGGCLVWDALRPKPEEGEKDQQKQAATRTGGSGRSTYHPWWYRSGSTWGSSASSTRTGNRGARTGTTGSVRSGGFGSTGHAVSAGS